MDNKTNKKGIKMCKDENKVVATENKTNYLEEIKNTNEMCSLLMKHKHYSKMGVEGIFAIIQTAKSLTLGKLRKTHFLQHS